ncbi:MAG: hypothetical protein ACXVZ2_10390 [Gaiellaceae bacterium]
MPTAVEQQAFLADVNETAGAIGRLAKQEPVFAAAVDALRAQDAESYHDILARLKLPQECGIVCDWICSKECVVLCLELCGPPKIDVAKLPSPLEFAKVVIGIVENEELVELLADAIQERDRDAWRELLAKAKVDERFCHLLCHWACMVHCRLVCRYVCGYAPRGHLIPELVSVGRALSEFVRHEKAFTAAVGAVQAADCEILRSTLASIKLEGHCEIICEWFFSWRCIRVCLTLCGPFPLEAVDVSVKEMWQFAEAVGALAGKPALEQLAEAAFRDDAETFGELVRKLKLERFCIQLCHWLCVFRCHVFCRCVCPNPTLQPWWTKVGHFDIYADIDATTGKTNKSLSYSGLSYGGGPHFAFFDCLELRGFCPATSPTFPGVAMRYRFTYDDGSGPLPIGPDKVCNVDAGSRLVDWPQNLGGVAGPALVPTFQTVTIAGADGVDPIPPAPGDPWVGPAAHIIAPGSDGWVTVDPNTVGGGYQVLLGFKSETVVPGGIPPDSGAGNAVADPKGGKDLKMNFEATRVGIATIDYHNGLDKIHINNWREVNKLWFEEFGTDCCTPIDATLTVEFTVDHEEMDAGAWELEITSCSISAPGNITPTVSSPPDVTVSARGGYGKIVEDTSGWLPCSYTANLLTRPALTTGLIDRDFLPDPLTFCICGHGRD